MISAYCNHLVNATHEDRFFFQGSVKHGERTREIQLSVDAHVIAQLAEILKVTKHAGHAVWHYKNPDADFPCSGCK